jgi:PfaD family protein
LVRAAPGAALRLAVGGNVVAAAAAPNTHQLIASLPALYPEWLGNRAFCETHGLRFPYVAGEMANGIATTRLVVAMARAGMLGFFGAAGLALEKVEHAVDELARTLDSRAPWGVNLIHSPNEPDLERRVADLLIARRVPRISASAFLDLSPALVRCAAAGLHTDPHGRIVRARHVFAKISRPEVAEKFMRPAPPALLQHLVSSGALTPHEAQLAAHVPVAEDITVEADSGGHTDNRPLGALLPVILALRDALNPQLDSKRPLRIGAAGGLGTPHAVAAAFALGADYVLTGSINQAALESGLSEDGRTLLAQADIADVMMAPAADMFEQGVKVQVLKRGTMFGARGAKLYEVYRSYPSLDAIPADVRTRLERDTLRSTLAAIWADTARYWESRDPQQLRAAAQDPKHKMALAFRWYLGNASRWAIAGHAERRTDYQIWCGPAMGAFNRWAAGSFLAEPRNRSVVQIARNLLEGAAVITRAQQARSYGVAVPAAAFDFRPRLLS